MMEPVLPGMEGFAAFPAMPPEPRKLCIRCLKLRHWTSMSHGDDVCFWCWTKATNARAAIERDIVEPQP